MISKAISYPKKHIVILCSRLDLPGGIERAIANTSNLFEQCGHKVSLLVLDIIAESFYPLHSAIDIVQINLNFGITSKGNVLSRKIKLIRDIRTLTKALEKLHPDFVIGTEYQFSIAAHFAAKRLLTSVFAWEHHHFYWLQRNFFWERLFRKIYPKLDAVVCLNTKEEKLFKSIGCSTEVIPNFISKRIKARQSAKVILTVGWLIKRKGVDMIPSIAEKVFSKHKDWKWKVIGSNTGDVDLKKMFTQKCLEQNIEIIQPSSHNLSAIYNGASILVMTSRFECFPMVLLEAMSFGIPCISFDCPTGPSDIIQNGIDGVLVEKENIEAMAATIIDLIENEDKRMSFGDQAFSNIQRFSPKTVYQLWENLFKVI